MPGLRPVSFKKGREHAPRLSPVRIPGRHSDRFWTDAEKQLLKQHYPNGGAAACQAHLPGRPVRSIYQQARTLGLAFTGPKGQRKPRETIDVPADFDERLRDRWAQLQGRGAVNALADELGVPRWWLTKRATKLGLTSPHKKEPPWTAAEDALMRKVPLHSPDRCSDIFREHGFRRSPTAIVVRAKRLALSRRATHENFSGTQAARILGVDNKTFTQWCIAGEVRATRRGTNRLPQQGGDVWDVPPTELRRFIIENIDRIDIRKVDKHAFVHLLTTAGEAGNA